MKKRLSLLLCIVMVLAMIVPAAAAADTAQPTQDAVTVDGSKVAVAGYKISDNNYFKLRDLAAAVAGTAYQFDVAFDAAASRVDITTGKAYTHVGGELSGTAAASPAAESAWSLYVDGEKADVSVYAIGGNNYYKLRDIGALAGFGVGYNEYSKTARIITEKEIADGVHVDADPASPTGYTVTFVLTDNGYQSVKLNGNFTFVPVITEETDYDNEYIPQMDDKGMAIKGEDGKSVVEVGRSLAEEKENIKADTLLVDDKELPVIYTAYEWSKSVQYGGVTTTLDHWTSTVDFEMERDTLTGKWTISMPLPSGAYSYTYQVTTNEGESKSILDPVNQEQWYTKSVPTEEDKGFEGTNQGYRQAFATLTEKYGSYAYVPFDAEKQVYDWDFLHPVSDKVCEGTRLADVEYKTPTNTETSPEVAQAYKDGLSDATGLVDFINDTGYLGIYLPKGYDAKRAEPYKVVYWAHGGRGAQDLPKDLIRVADNAMEDGVEDFIIVTFNCYASATDKAWPSWFDWKVLVNLTQNIIPFMEENYNVVKDESGRAICGFSAGGAVSHYALLYYSDWFDYFGIWGCGESTTVPGDFNAYVNYIKSYEDYKDKGLEDETVLIGAGSYDVARAGGYTVDGTKDAVQTIRYDHTYRAYMGLRDVVGIENLQWINGHSNHDGVTSNWAANLFFRDYLWK